MPRNDVPEPFHHRLHAPILPQEAMAAAGAEIGDGKIRHLFQPLDLLPHPGHGAGIEHLKLELAHAPQNAARAQLVEDGERRDLPHGGLDPGAVEGQHVLAVLLLQQVFGKAEGLEPVHEFRREHLALAVEGVAAQPGGFATGQGQAAHMVELLAQLACIDDVGQADAGGAVMNAERDLHVPMATKDRLRHQELVEVRIQHRPDDRIDLPGMVVDPGRDVRHRLLLTV